MLEARCQWSSVAGWSVRTWQPRVSVRDPAAASRACAARVRAASSVVGAGHGQPEGAGGLDGVRGGGEPRGVAPDPGAAGQRGPEHGAVGDGHGPGVGLRGLGEPPRAGERPRDVVGRAATHDEALEQAVRGEPVGPVQAGARDLPRRPEPRHPGPPVGVGDDAAARVVRGGPHGDRVAGEVDADRRARGGDRREARGDVRDARGVEPDVVDAERRDPPRDRRGDDVARGEVAERVHAGRDRGAGRVAQHRALAAQGLGDERGAAVGSAAV